MDYSCDDRHYARTKMPPWLQIKLLSGKSSVLAFQVVHAIDHGTHLVEKEEAYLPLVVNFQVYKYPKHWGNVGKSVRKAVADLLLHQHTQNRNKEWKKGQKKGKEDAEQC